MSNLEWSRIDDESVKVAKLLAADSVEKVGNGHPGTAISLAPVAYLLFQKILRHDPSNVDWVGRDRFILSAGHSSLTLYIQLYLGGFGLELDDLKALRTENSLTPGHPEYGHTKGVEITTGPLGQGLASAVGFAYAARYERGLFDPDTEPGKSPFDHNIWVIAGDGDLQEGITSEASSLAGHQQLGNLITIYDSNQISIEDDTNIAFTEDVKKRYESYGWQVLEVNWRKSSGYEEDIPALFAAIQEAKAESKRPTLIILKTIIGWPSPTKQNTGKIHGSALGAEELAALKATLSADPEKHFDVPDEVISHTRALLNRNSSEISEWQRSFESWASDNPEKAQLFERLQNGCLPEGLEDSLPSFTPGESVSTRAASGKVINAIAPLLPELWGGSADLADSNNTTISGAASFAPTEHSTAEWKANVYGRVLHFGIREHAMAAIINGIVLHGKTRAFGGTFLVFSDYMRPSVRLAALMKIPSIFVWTHDSVGLGEDGPTHQPIEHLATLRAIPGLNIVRPADANEVSWAWIKALQTQNAPTGIVLSRQNLTVLPRDESTAKDALHGAYIVKDAKSPLSGIILATGSEVKVALDAAGILESEGIGIRVVSFPSFEWFDAESAEYRESILPKEIQARVSVEAGLSLGWEKYTGAYGEHVSIEHFGESADGALLLNKFGINSATVVQAVKRSIEGAKR